MRLISQSGAISAELEAHMVRVVYETIQVVEDAKTDYCFGRYASEDRAIEVFDQIHDAYTEGRKAYKMPFE